MIRVKRRSVVRRLRRRVLRSMLGIEDPLHDMLDLHHHAKLKKLESTRYLRRGTYRKRALDVFSLDVPEDSRPGDSNSSPLMESQDSKHLTDAEFLKKYRMSRDSFDSLLNMVECHPVFDPVTGDKRCGPCQSPRDQLLTLLHFLGREGSCASGTKNTLFIGYGTHYLYVRRAIEAIRSLRDEVVTWPDEDERKQISQRMKDKYDFPGCVCMGDGTLFPLVFAPSTDDAPDYSGRKYGYSLTCFIISDDKRRIRQYLAGWPGSVHDNRVFGKMKANTSPESHFSSCEYMLSDSALENCDYVVAAFKKPPLKCLPRENERFNTKLAVARIIAEHTIGLLKGRFPWLKRIRNRITRDKKSMRFVLQLIDCCVILHNLLLPGADEENLPNWFDEEELSDVDDDSRAPTLADRLYRPIAPGCRKDERRRRLQTYLEFIEHCK